MLTEYKKQKFHKFIKLIIQYIYSETKTNKKNTYKYVLRNIYRICFVNFFVLQLNYCTSRIKQKFMRIN